MSNNVRCKLIVTALNPWMHTHDDGTQAEAGNVTLKAVHAATYKDGKFHSYEQACEENKVFGHWTPSAHFTMGIVNPEAWKVFKDLGVGKEYYVDLTPADTIEDCDEQRRRASAAADQK